ncbi:MAG: acyl-CoA dehydrogenase, partial [Hyphomonas sp.]|nr:acyl-CoA dehydrogenase [Hyphomonas sp.]
MDGAAEGSALNSAVVPNLVSVIRDACTAVDAYADAARGKCRETLTKDNGRPDRAALERQQHVAHGLSWLVTYAETLRQTADWAGRLDQEGSFGTTEALLTQILFSEYCAQLVGGIPMNQGEVIRPHELGIEAEADVLFAAPAVQQLIRTGKTPAVMAAAAECLPDALGRNTVEETGLDETMSMVRDQFSKYASDK